MTEAGWWVRNDPMAMLELLRDRADMRKWRLFAAESCRRVLAVFYYPDLEAVVEYGARMAEGLWPLPSEDQDLIQDALDWGLGEPCETLNHLAEATRVTVLPHLLTVDHGRHVVRSISSAFTIDGSRGDEHYEFQSALLRELFGNPFYPMGVNRRWLTSPVVDLAHTMYESRDFAAMPILADALQEAGCEGADILAHCRGGGPHVRGCWVVDLILGKS